MEQWKSMIDDILIQYSLSKPNVEFIRHNENLTCQVIDEWSKMKYVLRVHLPIEGFLGTTAQHDLPSLNAELMLIEAIGTNTDIQVQKPIRNQKGDLVTSITDEHRKTIHATLLSWVEGNSIDLKDPNIIEYAYLVGVMIAKLHRFSDHWEETSSLNRHHYDQKKVDRVLKLLEEGIELNKFSKEQYKIINKGGEKIKELMSQLDKSRGMKGIIHADLARGNLIIKDGNVTPIDFCLCGHGYYYMDIAGATSDLIKYKDVLLKGYETIRTIPKEDYLYIDAFFLFSIYLFMSTHLKNSKFDDWFERRIEPICQEYVIPLINNQPFFISK